jgi:tetratricopeptide (TPR) repeat protein
MQIYGFARIYDARAGSVDATTAHLDRVLCILWFGASVYVLNDGLRPYVANAYRSGVPLLSDAAMDAFRGVWIVATGATTLFYAVHTLRRMRAGHAPSPLKLGFLVLSFGVLGFAESITDRPLVGYVIFESWHDIQYLAFTWQFTARRTERPPAPGRFLLFFFRPGVAHIAAYLALCLAFGALTHTHRLFDDSLAVRLALAFVAATAMLHYYLDGFIWKIREQENRETLGVTAAGRSAAIEPRPVVPGWMRHAALWSLFLVPAGIGLSLETRTGPQKESEIHRSLVTLFPRSPQSHVARAHDLAGMGRIREAIDHFETAVRLEPDLLEAHLALATIPGVPLDEARDHADTAIRLAPRDPRSHHAAALAASEAGDPDAARKHADEAARLAPDASEIRSLRRRLQYDD